MTNDPCLELLATNIERGPTAQAYTSASVAPDAWLATHGPIVTSILVVMFVAVVAYAAWVAILDVREQREQERADVSRWGAFDDSVRGTMQGEAYTFQQRVQQRIAADQKALDDIRREDAP